VALHLAVTGASGRMGKRLVSLIAADPELELVSAVEAAGHDALGSDAGELAGAGKLGVEVTAGLAGEIDCIIDFSFHEAAPGNAAAAVDLKAGLVCGTTGLTPEERAAVEAAAEYVPLVFEPNMSVGVNLLFESVGKVAASLGEDYDVEIVETHHRFKKDAPSGTALKLAGKIADGRTQKLEKAIRHGREGQVGERPRGEIGMHAVRQGDVVGEHVITFTTIGETVTVAHRAHSRDAFASGALRAAKFLAGKGPGRYSMAEVLGL